MVKIEVVKDLIFHKLSPKVTTIHVKAQTLKTWPDVDFGNSRWAEWSDTVWSLQVRAHTYGSAGKSPHMEVQVKTHT